MFAMFNAVYNTACAPSRCSLSFTRCYLPRCAYTYRTSNVYVYLFRRQGVSQILTRSCAVAERPRDASCMSVLSFSSTIPRSLCTRRTDKQTDGQKQRLLPPSLRSEHRTDGRTDRRTKATLIAPFPTVGTQTDGRTDGQTDGQKQCLLPPSLRLEQTDRRRTKAMLISPFPAVGNRQTDGRTKAMLIAPFPTVENRQTDGWTD